MFNSKKELLKRVKELEEENIKILKEKIVLRENLEMEQQINRNLANDLENLSIDFAILFDRYTQIIGKDEITITKNESDKWLKKKLSVRKTYQEKRTYFYDDLLPKNKVGRPKKVSK